MNHQGKIQGIIKEKYINHDNHHDESKTRAHRFSKLFDDGDHWALNNLLKTGAKQKHQLNPGGPSNRREASITSSKKVNRVGNRTWRDILMKIRIKTNDTFLITRAEVSQLN